MDGTAQPRYPPDASFNGGDLDCGGGLLLLIRKHIDPLARGQILEVRSTEPSVEQDLPSWCRLTGNQLLSSNRSAGTWSFLICKGSLAEQKESPAPLQPQVHAERRVEATRVSERPPKPAVIPDIAPLSVMGIGSWPRPRWMLQAMHEHVEGRLGEDEFQATADDAVRTLRLARELRGERLRPRTLHRRRRRESWRRGKGPGRRLKPRPCGGGQGACARFRPSAATRRCGRR